MLLELGIDSVMEVKYNLGCKMGIFGLDRLIDVIIDGVGTWLDTEIEPVMELSYMFLGCKLGLFLSISILLN